MEWKKIDGFEGYEVSDTGLVRGIERTITIANGCKRLIKEKIIKPRISRSGYVEIKLSRNYKQFNLIVHRLVALAFIPNTDNLPQVNHKDGNKLNNNVDNLEWCSRSDNQKHSFRTGLNKNCGCDHQSAQPVRDRKTDIKYCAIIVLCKILDIPYNAIIKALNTGGELPPKYGLSGHLFERFYS